MSFDEEYVDPHGECAAEIARLKDELFALRCYRTGQWRTIEDVEQWIEREALPYEVVPLGVVGDLRAKLARLVPSQPDTGTKDWRGDIANIINGDLSEGKDAEYILAHIAEALQRLSKGKNDDQH